jgi:hypothetical protein
MGKAESLLINSAGQRPANKQSRPLIKPCKGVIRLIPFDYALSGRRRVASPIRRALPSRVRKKNRHIRRL